MQLKKKTTTNEKKKFGFKSKQNMTTLENAIQQTNINDEMKKPLASSANQDIFNTESTCSIKDIDGGEVIKLGTEINGKDIGIVNVKNACIQLIGHPSVVHAANIENCTILCGPVSGSAFFNNLKHVKLIICCKVFLFDYIEKNDL